MRSLKIWGWNKKKSHKLSLSSTRTALQEQKNLKMNSRKYDKLWISKSLSPYPSPIRSKIMESRKFLFFQKVKSYQKRFLSLSSIKKHQNFFDNSYNGWRSVKKHKWLKKKLKDLEIYGKPSSDSQICQKCIAKSMENWSYKSKNGETSKKDRWKKKNQLFLVSSKAKNWNTKMQNSS